MEERQKDIAAMELDWASNGFTDTADDEVYRKLYHSSIQTCSDLQEQLLNYSGLLSKYRKISELKDLVLSGINERVSKMACMEAEMRKREADWKHKLLTAQQKQEAAEKDCAAMKKECEKLREDVAASIVSAAMARAESQLKEELVQQMKTKKSEAEKEKSKFSKYSQSLKRRYKEIKESYDFVESEKSSLEQTIEELEAQVSSLAHKLETKPVAPVPEPSRNSTMRVEELELPEKMTSSIAACSTCSVLKEQLSVVTDTLNGRNLARHGDLLHTNFILRQKLSHTERELADVTVELQHLGNYFTDYKNKSTQKVAILKDNVKKADEEIAELDKLVESMAAALHDNLDVIRDCPQLMDMLQELEGGYIGSSSHQLPANYPPVP